MNSLHLCSGEFMTEHTDKTFFWYSFDYSYFFSYLLSHLYHYNSWIFFTQFFILNFIPQFNFVADFFSSFGLWGLFHLAPVTIWHIHISIWMCESKWHFREWSSLDFYILYHLCLNILMENAKDMDFPSQYLVWVWVSVSRGWIWDLLSLSSCTQVRI